MASLRPFFCLPCARLARILRDASFLSPFLRHPCANHARRLRERGVFSFFEKRSNVDAEHPKYGARKFHAKRLFRTGKAVAAAAAATGRQLRCFTTNVSKVISSLLFGLPPWRSENTNVAGADGTAEACGQDFWRSLRDSLRGPCAELAQNP